MSVSNQRLIEIGKYLFADPEAIEEIRTRFQLRMLKRFRGADKQKRRMINAIMDNEQAFWEEMKIILGQEEQTNIEGEEDDAQIDKIERP